MTEDLTVARSSLDNLGSEMLLSKRKIELRERYFKDKEKSIIEREHILRNAEEQLQFDRDELIAKLDESS